MVESSSTSTGKFMDEISNWVSGDTSSVQLENVSLSFQEKAHAWSEALATFLQSIESDVPSLQSIESDSPSIEPGLSSWRLFEGIDEDGPKEQPADHRSAVETETMDAAESSRQPLVVMSGWLSKKSRRRVISQWKTRYWLLTEAGLLMEFAVQCKAPDALVLLSRQTPIRSIQLRECRIRFEEGKRRIYVSMSERILCLKCAEDFHIWREVLQIVHMDSTQSFPSHSYESPDSPMPSNDLGLGFAGASDITGYRRIQEVGTSGKFEFEDDGNLTETTSGVILYNQEDSWELQSKTLKLLRGDSDPWAIDHILQVHMNPVPSSKEFHLTFCVGHLTSEDLLFFTEPFERSEQIQIRNRPQLYIAPKGNSLVKRRFLQMALEMGFGPIGVGWTKETDSSGREIWVILRPPFLAINPKCATNHSSSDSHIIFFTFILRNPGLQKLSRILQFCNKFRVRFFRHQEVSSVKFQIDAEAFERLPES